MALSSTQRIRRLPVYHQNSAAGWQPVTWLRTTGG